VVPADLLAVTRNPNRDGMHSTHARCLALAQIGLALHAAMQQPAAEVHEAWTVQVNQ